MVLKTQDHGLTALHLTVLTVLIPVVKALQLDDSDSNSDNNGIFTFTYKENLNTFG